MTEHNELDYIEDDATVTESTRTSDTTAIMWAELQAGPAMNAVEVAADHGVEVKEIKRTGAQACYHVQV